MCKNSPKFHKAVVASAGCVVFSLIAAIARLSAQLFPAIRLKFGVDRERASQPFILVFTVRSLSGPIVGYCGNQFGLRCTTVFGCFLSAVSIGACFFAEDIVSFTILWGAVFGFGFAVGTTLICNILHLHFKDNFNKMYGLVLASSCLTAFTMPGLADYLLKEYGISGTFLVFSGLALHCVPAALLMVVPEKPQNTNIQSELEEKHQTSNANSSATYYENSNSVTEQAVFYSKENDMCEINNKLFKINGAHCESTFQKENFVTTLFISCSEDEKLEKDFVQMGISSTDEERITNKNILTEQPVVKYMNVQDQSPSNTDQLTMEAYKSKAEDILPAKRLGLSKTRYRNLRVFIDPVYILVLIFYSFSIMALTTIYTVMVDACSDKGIVRDIPILMTFAIMEMVGNFGFGYWADFKCISTLNLHNLCCVLCGLGFFSLTWMKEFYSVVVVFAVMGASLGGFATLSTGIVREYMPGKDLTMALSSRLLLTGLLSFSQPSIIGYFRETLQSYDGLFYLMGSLCILAAVTAAFIPLVARWRDRRKYTLQRSIT